MKNIKEILYGSLVGISSFGVVYSFAKLMQTISDPQQSNIPIKYSMPALVISGIALDFFLKKLKEK